MKIKTIIKNEKLRTLYYKTFNVLHKNRKYGHFWHVGWYPKLAATIIKSDGEGNRITFGKKVFLENCRIIMSGNNCRIIIGSNSHLIDTTIICEDDRNLVEIGERVVIAGATQLACTEGKTIQIGNDCLFANDIVIRTGDSHSILDQNGNRTNHAKDVRIGEHCWICERAIILKGSVIGDDSIVSAGAVVVGGESRGNSVIGGNPAKVVKTDVSWDFKRL